MIQLDTHVVCWLHDGLIRQISPAARQALNTDSLSISPMVELELHYLHEIGRLRTPPVDMLHTLHTSLGLSVSQTSFALVASAAAGIRWTRDAFDRLIVAQAQCDSARLVSADEKIRQHFAGAIW
ncbi:MAG: PIN domain nuclease [Candidatus Dactylopiibacterium carminicum]|uniref:PIN domain nuclease n=1 Tax=Candidatus Dactylopiibacterium carminicum TaxID=857335 RepID=A0A272EV26_9RHOO|nr:PIN domain-containing protein [Candidatus Dactylopiibacterium carminicum]KAF7599857.1 PIN domain nuclease [Candidatus Dactylopiibacterium carminicum]PAS93968.1 MAG: PIN domain nuclease [Candidatus Dactylopiibacterium carminicum]PAS97283.1 MAG: PIN domain nuclease [Candidatus Dactylopiibacterium carminicum]PAS99858.1 MAG: hypothetical protein BSR46_05940 [Candidatus Dactylopiibacterium carminicum]